MFDEMLVLSSVCKYDGGGVGLSRIIEDCKEVGCVYSKYKMRQVLKSLVKVGALHRVKNHYVVTLFGANLCAADVATSHGYDISYELKLTVGTYQKGMAI